MAGWPSADGGAERLGPELTRLRKTLTAFGGGMGGKAARAWTTAQLQQIKDRCDAIGEIQAEMGRIRGEMKPLLEAQRETVREAKLELLNEHQAASDARTRGTAESKAAWQALTVARRLGRGAASGAAAAA